MSYAMALDNSFEILTEEEMYDVNGGISFWAKIGIGALIVGAGIALVVALSYGQIYLAAKILKLTFSGVIKKYGEKLVAGVIIGAIKVSYSVVLAAIKEISKL